MQPLQFFAGVDTEFVGQDSADLLKGLESVGTPAGNEQCVDQPEPQGLPRRIDPDSIRRSIAVDHSSSMCGMTSSSSQSDATPSNGRPPHSPNASRSSESSSFDVSAALARATRARNRTRSTPRHVRVHRCLLPQRRHPGPKPRGQNTDRDRTVQRHQQRGQQHPHLSRRDSHRPIAVENLPHSEDLETKVHLIPPMGSEHVPLRCERAWRCRSSQSGYFTILNVCEGF